MDQQGTKVRDELAILPGYLVLEVLSQACVLLATVHLIDVLSHLLDRLLALDEVAVVRMLWVRQLDELVHEQWVFANALDGLDQLRRDGMIRGAKVVQFLCREVFAWLGREGG